MKQHPRSTILSELGQLKIRAIDIESVTRDILIIQARESILDCMILDAWETYEAGVKIGAVILAACALDVLGRLLTGGKKTKTAGFNQFLEKYMPKYLELEDPYGKFRSSLVHAYSAKEYAFSENCADLHCTKVEQGCYLIDVAIFLSDVKKAAESYLDDLKHDDSLFKELLDAIRDEPLVKPGWILIGDQDRAHKETTQISGTPPDRISGTASYGLERGSV